MPAGVIGDERMVYDEDKVVRDNLGFIRNCAWEFITESRIKPSDCDDVFQEAALAYLLWHRKARNGELGKDGWKYAKTAIRYHLLSRFVDRHGIGVHWQAIRTNKIPEVILTDEPDTDEVMFDDTNIYFRDWLSMLSDEDREIVISRMATGHRSPTYHKSASTYSAHLRKIRTSFDDYFRAG